MENGRKDHVSFYDIVDRGLIIPVMFLFQPAFVVERVLDTVDSAVFEILRRVWLFAQKPTMYVPI